MTRLRRVKAAFAAVMVAAGVGTALVLPASPAVAYYSGGLFLDILAESPARLLANGAAVDVPIQYTCNASSSTIYVSVSQRVANGDLATGFASTQVLCTGAHQRTTITVPASGAKAFAKGNAFVSSNINGCLSTPTFTCGSEYNDVTVKFRR